MLYKKEITDPILIQYIILFTLAKADRLVTHDQLTSLVLDNCNIKFTDFRVAVDNLEKLGHLRVFAPDDKEAYCELLASGKEVNSYFYKKIPKYIREPISKYIAPFFHDDELKKSIVADFRPLNEDEYVADLSIFEGKTPLMKLSLYAGSRAYANSMMREFKKDPQKVYEALINMLGNGEIKNEDN